jgi:hypothetical protein
MGGSSKQVNPQQAAAADAGATASAQASARLADQFAAQSKTAFNTLFGSDTNSATGGTLGGFLNPANLTATSRGPTGPYKIQYDQALGNLAGAQAAQRGALSQSLQNRGFGIGSPSGFGATQALQQSLGQAQQTGQLFSDYTNQGYQDALRNMWSAAGILSGQGTSAMQGSLQGQGQAGQTYANLYGTAGRQAQGSSLLGSMLGAGGSILGGWLAA